jgi:hypothetical protein
MRRHALSRPSRWAAACSPVASLRLGKLRSVDGQLHGAGRSARDIAGLILVISFIARDHRAASHERSRIAPFDPQCKVSPPFVFALAREP